MFGIVFFVDGGFFLVCYCKVWSDCDLNDVCIVVKIVFGMVLEYFKVFDCLCEVLYCIFFYDCLLLDWVLVKLVSGDSLDFGCIGVVVFWWDLYD